jgi:hypothetical protein
LDRRLGGLQNRSGRHGEEKNLDLLGLEKEKTYKLKFKSELCVSSFMVQDLFGLEV